MTPGHAATSATARAMPRGRLLALIVGQLGLHAAMAGLRMAVPLLLLHQGARAWAVGAVVALFAVAPVLLALPAGRMADRRGYHPPMRLAVAATALGGMCAVVAAWAVDWPLVQAALLGLAALASGGGAHAGLITVQRTAGRSAADATERKQVFSWLGLAPALANLIGPVLAGLLIDHAGHEAAFAAMAALPLVTLRLTRRVPVETPAAPPGLVRPKRPAWELVRAPGMQRLLIVNWLLSAAWDLHGLLLPILGHERGFSASAIGLILGGFATAVSAVRLVIPVVARHAREPVVLAGAMLWTGAVFAVYPFVTTAWAMGLCAVLLGLALGCTQPMVMSTLHQLTPEDRHGEAIALRSMMINSSSAALPLLFGVVGAAVGAATLFWAMGCVVAAGSWAARGVGAPRAATP